MSLPLTTAARKNRHLLPILFIHTWIAVAICILCCYLFPTVHALDIASCNRALGMESGTISDSQIAASSSYDEVNVGARHARLRKEERGGAWCPAKQIEETVYEFLQIDLRRLHVITAIETQGRFGNGHGVEYAEAYIVEYQREAGEWKVYRNRRGERIVKANKNTYVAERVVLDPPLIAQSVRLVPRSKHARTVCMRVEFHGCTFEGEAAVWYSMPQGDVYNVDTQLYDDSYDGYGKDGRLYLGLGQLVDGVYGAEHISFRKKTSKSTNESGSTSAEMTERPAFEWIGWRNNSVRDGSGRNENGVTSALFPAAKSTQSQPIDITWKFENVREFKAVHIHASNLLHRNIGLFSKVSLMFSIGGKYYLDDPLVFDLGRATSGANNKRGLMSTEPALNVSIPINNRIGQYIKMLLYFSNEWMLLSEITFESAEADLTNVVTEAASTAAALKKIEEMSSPKQLLSVNSSQKSLPLAIGQPKVSNDSSSAEDSTAAVASSTTSLPVATETAGQQLILILCGALVAACFIFAVILIMLLRVQRRSRYMSASSRRHSKFRSTRSSSTSHRSDFLFHFDSKPPENHHTNVTEIGGPLAAMGNTMTFHTNPAMSGVNIYGSERGSDDSNQTAEAIYQEPGEACLSNGMDSGLLYSNGYPSPFTNTYRAQHQTNSPAALYRNAATCGAFNASQSINSPSSLLNTLYNHQRLLQQQQAARTIFPSPLLPNSNIIQHQFAHPPPLSQQQYLTQHTNFDFAPYNTMSTLSTLVPVSSTCGGTGSGQFFPTSSNCTVQQHKTGLCLNSIFPPPPASPDET